MTTERAREILRRGWLYVLRSLERPARIPGLLGSVLLRRAHLGETLNSGRFARWLVQSGIQTVVDVGAHTGEFASGIKAVLPDCVLYSFEPQPAQYARLVARLERYANSRAFNVAVGSSTGERVLHQSRFTKASSLLPMTDLHRAAYSWSAAAADIVVRVDTLDRLLPRELRGGVLLKLDVQGFEVEVLRGAAQTLERTDHVLVETSVGGTLYEGEATFDDVYALLKAAGFRYAGTWDQLCDPRTDAPLQVDALFSRSVLR
jgi:FkbM family methyltransferase